MQSTTFFALLFTSLLIVGSSTAAWGAQLDAKIDPNQETANMEIKYQRTVFIEYGEGGNLADLLRGKSWSVDFTADSSNSGVQELLEKMNQKIIADGSTSRITDLVVEYGATLTGRGLNTSIDYKIILRPELSFFSIRDYSPNSPALIDAEWRGLGADGPVTIDGVEINMPISIIKQQEPEVYQLLSGTEAETILMNPLINADGIRDQPLGNWHFLFDPTGINVDASTFGLSEEISGFVVSSYTMGESSIREGRQVERIQEATFSADRDYIIRAVQSSDSAGIRLIGFASVDEQYGSEVFGVSPTPPANFATTATGEFPVMIIYGMAGMAVIGAVGILFISSRKLKAEAGMGQQGIDPSQLRGVETSASSGGYQTVRGEAQLASDATYEQTQNVYDKEKQSESASNTSSSTKGSMPKGWKPS